MQTVTLLLLTCLILAGCSVFGKRDVREPSFSVLKSEGDFEIRRYEPMVLAETVVEGDYRSTSGKAFGRLSGYIFGKNRSKRSIEMTAPVLQEKKGEKIAMTAPVIQEKEGDAWSMAFVLPEGYTVRNAPEPLDSEILLRQVPGAKVAVIVFSGLHSEKNIDRHTEKLQAWLEGQGYAPASSPRAASYDPPWTIPFLRRNEIHIDIR